MIITGETLTFSGIVVTFGIFLIGFIYSVINKKDKLLEDKFKEKDAIIDKRFENRDALIKELEKEIGHTKSNYNEKFEKVYNKVDKIAEKLEAVHTDLATLIGEHNAIIQHHHNINLKKE